MTPAGRLQVLVVEDESLVAAAHADFVARVPGFAVADVVGTVRDAVRTIVARPIDLVLLDLNLPDGHGLDLVRTIRGAGKQLDILAITAAREAQTVRAAVNLGVVGYLLKPFVFSDLKARLESYRGYRGSLAPDTAASQAQVDRLLQDLHRPPGPSSAPKGLTRELLGQIESVLQHAESPDGLSASQVGDLVGTSRVTARRYLEHLAELGALDRGQRLGGTGRPEITFRWR